MLVQNVTVLAYSNNYSHENEYKSLYLTEEIENDIKNSNSQDSIWLYNELITYYYGENYTIVEDCNDYYKISFLENGEILVNDKLVESRITIEDEASLFDISYNLSNSYEWIPMPAIYREYNVIGLAPSVIGGIIGGYIGAKIGGKLGYVFNIAGGTIIGTIVGGNFSEYYISIKTQQYYKYPIITSRPEIKTEYYVYHGPKYDRYQNFWFLI